jgi:threonine/homoserine/homoserine lactone efflux protein
MTLAFILTSLAVIVSPGTGALFTIATGLSRGWQASIIAAFGCTLGILPHMGAAITGLAALLHASALAFQTIKYLGVAYLFYMAWMTLKETGALNVDQSVVERSAFKTISHAVLINILNPKLTLFFFAFLPQFVQPGSNQLLQMLGLSGVFMLLTFIVFAGYGIFAAAARNHVLSKPAILTWMRRSFAAGFVLLGARLAFEKR